MKRKLIYFMIVVGLATAVTLKVSQNKVDMNELTLLNIEALADNFSGDGNASKCFR